MAFDFSLSSLGRMKDENSVIVERGVEFAESGLAALATGYAQKSMPEYATVYGIDTALIAGGAMVVASLFDKDNTWGKHASNVGNGILAVYAGKLGASLATPSTDKQSGGNKGMLGAGTPAFGVRANDAAWARR